MVKLLYLLIPPRSPLMEEDVIYVFKTAGVYEWRLKSSTIGSQGTVCVCACTYICMCVHVCEWR